MELSIQCHLWPVSTVVCHQTGVASSCAPSERFLCLQNVSGTKIEKESDWVTYSLCCSHRVRDKVQEITVKNGLKCCSDTVFLLVERVSLQ